MAWTKEQELAIHTSGTNIIVSAGAGSGKTAVLSTRVLDKIAQGIHVDELLILTFTNAAAGEMKERIKKKIKEQGYMEELVRLDNSYITTFDSFSLSIVKKYHYLLNIPRNVQITDESVLSLQKRKILEEVFEHFYEMEEPHFLKLIHDFCLKEDEPLKKEILELANTLEIRTDKNTYLENYIQSYYNESQYQKMLHDYFTLLKEAVDEILDEIELQKSYFEQDYIDKLKEAIFPLQSETDLDSLIAKIQVTRLPTIPRGSDEEVKGAKKKISDLLKNLKEDLANFGNQAEIIEDYKMTQVYLTSVTQILQKYFFKLEAWKQKNQVYDFNDIAHLSLKILRDFKDIREELKCFFKEIMVDEYQDTSDIQEEFISLIENNNVYMVGDIKQSIYRFRNANPYIFKDKYDNYSKNFGGTKIDLLKNFRSRREVLEDINTIFNPIMTNTIGNADYIQSHQMIFGNGTYELEGATNENYHMDILEYDSSSKEFSKEEIEIFIIAQDIKKKVESGYLIFDKDEKKLHPATWQDFCIIMDRNSTFDLTKRIFEYFGIPLSMYKDDVLNVKYDLYILKNLVHLLLWLKDKNYDKSFSYSFVSIARSFLYRLPDEEIFDFLEKRNFWDSVILKDIAPVVPLIVSHSSREIIEALLNRTNFYFKCITTGDVAEKKMSIEKLLDLSESMKGLNYDIYKFYDYLENIIQEKQILKVNFGVSSSNAVKIMNIHKSKGLEFPVCYFAGLYKGFSKEDRKGNIIYEKTLPIFMPNCDFGKKDTILKLLIQDKMKKDDISEKIRLFYVGLTRAKEKIILVLPHKEDTTELKTSEGVVPEGIRYRYKSIADMLYSIPTTLKKYMQKIPLDSIPLSKDYKIPKDIDDYLTSTLDSIEVQEISLETPEEITHKSFSKQTKTVFTKEEKRNIELGLKVHSVLEFIDFKNFKKEDIKDKFIGNLVENMLKDSLFQNIQNAHIFQEYEFIYEQEQHEYHGIIDLMLEYETSIDIIDYKLSDITDENYLKQLQGYKNYIENVTKKEVHTYLYSILDSKIKKLS